jgi:hypothetical protein
MWQYVCNHAVTKQEKTIQIPDSVSKSAAVQRIGPSLNYLFGPYTERLMKRLEAVEPELQRLETQPCPKASKIHLDYQCKAIRAMTVGLISVLAPTQKDSIDFHEIPNKLYVNQQLAEIDCSISNVKLLLAERYVIKEQKQRKEQQKAGKISGQKRNKADPTGTKRRVRERALELRDANVDKRDWVGIISRELDIEAKSLTLPTIRKYIQDIYRATP